jgi:hypothetical protein
MSTTKYIVNNSTDQTINGNIGIGTTPSVALDVVGDIHMNGNEVQTVKYKTFTALLTQSGVDDTLNFGSDNPLPFVIGTTYEIAQNDDNGDFTNIGAPNNSVGTYFVATGTTPSSWGTTPSAGAVNVNYNAGAPVVKVLENTIGDLWFEYEDVGIYSVKSNELFIENKTWYTPVITLGMGGTDHRGIMYNGGGPYSNPGATQSLYYIRLFDPGNANALMFTGFFYVDNITNIIQTFYDSTNPTVNIKSTGGNGGPTFLYNPGWLCFDGGGVNITSFPYLYGATTGDYNLYGNVSSSTGNNVDGYGNVTYEFRTYDNNTISIATSIDKDNYANDLLNNTPIEIRVYNYTINNFEV